MDDTEVLQALAEMGKRVGGAPLKEAIVCTEAGRKRLETELAPQARGAAMLVGIDVRATKDAEGARTLAAHLREQGFEVLLIEDHPEEEGAPEEPAEGQEEAAEKRRSPRPAKTRKPRKSEGE